MSASAFEKLKVLVVEDNHHMRTLLKRMLGSIGIRDVIEAANGAIALQSMREHKCDLVLCDLSMQPVDGLQFCLAVRNAEKSPNPYLPIVMITGHTEKNRVEAARDAGVTEFLAKPITAAGLLSRLAEILERPRPFVRTESYFGPDRRRKVTENYAGPWRRQGDFADMQVG